MTDMTKPYDGGPAFPGPSFTQAGYPNGHSMGLTMRDWFAGQALANPYTTDHEHFPDKVAEWAYQVADAMLAARDAS
jgi:hypothetical protein